MKRITSIMILIMVFADFAVASDKYWDGTDTTGDANGGSGNWDNDSTANWDDAATGGNSVTWSNATPDSAFFGGANGTATLTGDITIQHMRFTAGTHTVAGYTLNFAAGGTITNAVIANQTITSGITGSPAVGIMDNTSAKITFAPTSVDQILGTCTVPYEAGSSDKATIEFGGTTTGNSIAKVTYQSSPDNHWGAMYKTGSGTWSVGNVDIGSVYMQAGSLIVTGTVHTYYAGLQLQGGVFHYNNAGAVYNGLTFSGGSLENSSGAAITTPTYNVAQTWGGNLTFIGSNGANSDLNLGTGAVTLSGNRTVTVSNALTTLTVGGVIGDSTSVYGLTKAGAGTLKLTGINTYNGNTVVSAGTLWLTQKCLDDNAIVYVTNGATLKLDYTGTDTVFAVYFDGVLAAAGEWGGPASTAANKTNLLDGTGILYHNGGLALAGAWYWDGPNTGGNGNGAGEGGSGIWSIASTNWDGGVVARTAWNNTTNDKAIFQTLAGTVDLGSDVTLGEILIEGVDNYVIGGNPENYSLNFGGTNTIKVDQVTATIRAGITGSPKLLVYGNNADPLYLYPDSASMTLGDVTVGGVPNNPALYLGGAATNNSISRIISANNWSFLYKENSGTWSVGDINIGTLTINAGTLVINGTFSYTYLGFAFNGGTLGGTGVLNSAVTVPVAGTIAPGNPTGTLTVTNNNCTINGTLAITVDGESCSKLAVQNTLVIGSGTLDINVANAPVGAEFVIATYGSLTGTFAVTNDLPSNCEIDYSHDGSNAIALIVPPPGGTVLIVK